MSDEANDQALRDGLEPVALACHLYTGDPLFAASMAVSAKRQADALEQIAGVLQGFGDHPDNANSYGETGMRAVQGTLERTASSIVNEVSLALHHMRGNR